MQPPSPRVFGGSHSAPIATRGPVGLAFAPISAVPKSPASSGVAAPKAVPTRSTTLPNPDHRWTTQNKVAKRFPGRSLFQDRDGPTYEDIHQQGVANCYLAALLAALARTPNGRIRLRKTVTQRSGSIVTVARDYDNEKPGPERKIPSDRYFEVALSTGDPTIVSDVLYATDSDRDFDPIFMDSPNKLLWPSVIELAYATLCGGYDKIGSGDGVSWARCIQDFLGNIDYIKLNLPQKTWDRRGKAGAMEPGQFDDLLGSAATKPTIVATGKKPGQLFAHHSYAVIQHDKHVTMLYDPLTTVTMPVKNSDLKPLCEDVISISL